MTATTAVRPIGVPIQVPTWAFAVAVVAMMLAYVALQENGLLVSSWMTVHEFFHDGRHALGFPCH